ncbi:MAG: CGGC domain-containing protein, partial [Planctomycetota bacterium]
MSKYVVAVQCDIVKQRCSGYQCEREFHQRAGGFAAYEGDADVRFLSMTCGGCCGRAVHRKLGNLLRQAGKSENIEPADITVHLSSCVCKDNYHGAPCPHLDYLETIIGKKLGLQIARGTVIAGL